MKTQVLMLVGILSLVGCGGSGVPWEGEGPPLDPQVTGGTGGSGVGSSSSGGEEAAFGGTGIVVGGYGTGGTLVGSGGAELVGGDSSVGLEGGASGVEPEGGEGGDEAVGGTGSGGYETGGTGSGGYETGGTGSGGTGSYDPCSLNVAHCFEAAASCYEFSPWSDCDQIVDVCAALQADCAE